MVKERLREKEPKRIVAEGAREEDCLWSECRRACEDAQDAGNGFYRGAV
jgi:hypothetical protein